MEQEESIKKKCGYCGCTSIIGDEKERLTQYCANEHAPIYFHNKAEYCPLCMSKENYKKANYLLNKSVNELMKMADEKGK